MHACLCPRRSGPALALAALLLLGPSPGRADFLLPMNFQPGAPIVSGSNGGLTYNAATGDFHATLAGSSLVYAAPFVLPRGFTTFSGTLSIDLLVDHNGHFTGGGTGLVLTGTVTINGAVFTGTAANPLLTGTITAFGSDPAGPPSRSFDGYFTITGGALTQTMSGAGGKPVFGGFPLGQSGGFLLHAENVTGGTLGDFAHDFASSMDKPELGVLAAVPVPRSLVLCLTGAVALLGWTRPRLGRPRWLERSPPGTRVPLLSGAWRCARRGMTCAGRAFAPRRPSPADGRVRQRPRSAC
jgi:hypothetical protein